MVTAATVRRFPGRGPRPGNSPAVSDCPEFWFSFPAADQLQPLKGFSLCSFRILQRVSTKRTRFAIRNRFRWRSRFPLSFHVVGIRELTAAPRLTCAAGIHGCPIRTMTTQPRPRPRSRVSHTLSAGGMMRSAGGFYVMKWIWARLNRLRSGNRNRFIRSFRAGSRAGFLGIVERPERFRPRFAFVSE